MLMWNEKEIEKEEAEEVKSQSAIGATTPRKKSIADLKPQFENASNLLRR